MQSGLLGGAPTAFAGDDLKAVTACRVRSGKKRLENAASADRVNELSHAGRVKVAARLEWTGLEVFNRCVRDTGCRVGSGR